MRSPTTAGVRSSAAGGVNLSRLVGIGPYLSRTSVRLAPARTVAASAVETPSAISGAGMYFDTLSSTFVTTNVSAAIPMAAKLISSACRTTPCSLFSSPYSSDVVRPTTCSSCDTAITTAIPIVKPTTMEIGTFATMRPIRPSPSAIRTTPDPRPHQMRKVPPGYCCVMARITGMNAAVGPYTWYLDPPNRAPMSPATAPPTMPIAGGSPDAIAKPMASGIATIATISPAVRSRRTLRPNDPVRRSS